MTHLSSKELFICFAQPTEMVILVNDGEMYLENPREIKLTCITHKP